MRLTISGRNTHPQEFGTAARLSGELILTTKGNGQMRIHMKHYLAGLAVLTLTMPVWARTNKESVTLEKSKTIGSTQLKPGSYDFTADQAKKELNILQNGKVIATVQGQWVKIAQKAQYSTFDSDGDKITEVEFGGNDQAFQVQ
jgi:hypothetical protein